MKTPIMLVQPKPISVQMEISIITTVVQVMSTMEKTEQVDSQNEREYSASVLPV